MNRWKSLSVVAAVAGLIGLGIALRPAPDAAPQADPAATPVLVAPTSAPKQIAQPDRVAPRNTSAPSAARTPMPSARPTPGVQQKPASSNSSASIATQPVDPSPSSSPTTSALTAAAASPEPIVAAGVAAQPQAAPASAAKKDPVTLTLKKDSVIGILLDQAVSSETAKVEDKISAKVSRDVIVDGKTAIPAGARIEGTIVSVDRPTKANPRGKLGFRFTALVRPDNTRVPLFTETISREASDPSTNTGASSFNSNAFSAIVGGGSRQPPPKQTATASPTPTPKPSSKPRDIQLIAGAFLTVHLTAPVSITIDRDPE